MNFFLVILFTSIFLLVGCLRRDQKGEKLNPTVVPCPINFSIAAEALELERKACPPKISKKRSSSSLRCKSKPILPNKKISVSSLNKQEISNFKRKYVMRVFSIKMVIVVQII